MNRNYVKTTTGAAGCEEFNEMGTLVQNRRNFSSGASSTIHWTRSIHRSDLSQAEPEDAAALDSEIWRNLHPELVARILAHLPLTSLIHTRLLLRRYDREVYTARILPTSDVAARSGWLFLFENGGSGNAHKLHAFDPTRALWQTLATVPHFATVQKIGALALCAAAGGLMLYKISALKSHFVRFGVFNPVTRSWKKLPPLVKRRQRPVVAMFVAGAGHYKVVVAGGMEYEQQVGTTEVYDSRAECWRVSCDRFANPQSHVCEEVRTTTAVCDGVVYHLRFSQMLSFDPRREYHTFMAYNTKTARWRPLRIPLPSDLVFTEYPSLKRMWKGRPYLADVLPPFLVECNSRLLLVGFREDRLESTIAGVGVWELLVRKQAWKLVATMPDEFFCEMCPKMCVSSYVEPSSYLRYEVEGAGHGGVVYVFAARGAVECNLRQSSSPSWKWIHKSGIQGGERCEGVQGCVIDLRLDSLI